MKIAVVVGSLRIGSFNQQLAKLATKVAPEEVEMAELSLADLPFFNQDLEADLPTPVTTFKQGIAKADGVLLVTPEYNRSVPGLLKNAIDWASRPDKESAWNGKPVGVMGASNGQFGTQTAQFDLRRILTHANCLIMPQPQVYVAKAQEKLLDGNFDEATIKVVTRYMQLLTEWVKRNA